MTTSPAICPACAGLVQVEQPLPQVLPCPLCGARLHPRPNGAAVVLTPADAPPTESPQVTRLLKQAAGEKDPRKKHVLLKQALAENPQSYPVHLALLLLGTLHERDRRPGDLHNVKSYLLHVFEAPEAYDADRRSQLLEELTAAPEVYAALALAPDAETFWTDYYGALAQEYLEIFVRGRHSVSTFAFGLPRPQRDITKAGAGIVQGMLGHIMECEELPEQQRRRLQAAVRRACRSVFPGSGEVLYEA